MKKKIAVTLAVLMLLGAVAVAGTSFADSHISKINAVINREIKLTWDGQAFEPMDKGERLYPIIYGGRTYLPAAYVADKAGVGVDWDADTKTVSFESRVVNIDLTTPFRDNDSFGSSSSSSSSGTTSDSVARDLAKLPFTYFDLDIERNDDDDDLDVELEIYSSGSYKAEVEIELDDRKEVVLNGEQALNYLLPIFEDLNINANMSQRDIINEVIRAFQWRYGYEVSELEVLFRNGTRIDIEIED